MMTLYERFSESKEAGFREEFIKPLLVKMGFVGITNKHGVHELGKDYVFSELDRFGEMRNMAVQAKHKERISQGKEVDDLLSQIRQAFNATYRLKSSPSELRRISAVYVFNSGTITDGAINQIGESLSNEWKANTYFFDGHQLAVLAHVIGRQSDRHTRQRCNAIASQMKINDDVCEKYAELATNMLDGLPTTFETRGIVLSGVESYMNLPWIMNEDLLIAVNSYWQYAKGAMFIVQRHAIATGVERTAIENDMRLLLELSGKLRSLSKSIIEHFAVFIRRMPNIVID